MKLEDSLLKIMIKYREKFEKEQLEKTKKETEKIIENLNLQKFFTEQRRNELILNFEETRKKAKILKETTEKISQGFKNTNSIFNYMDNGKLDNNAKNQLSLKPILLKLFDDNKDNEINKEIDDKFGKESSVFDILNKSFKGKLVFDDKGNLLLDDKKETKEIEKDETESSESESNNVQKEKNKNLNRLRYR
ncbi:hypothetical protein ACOTVL_10620 [Aliarcobacter butzleri]